MYNGRGVNVSLKNFSDNERQDRAASLCRLRNNLVFRLSLAHIFLSFVFEMRKKKLDNHRPPSSIKYLCVLPMPWPLRSLAFSLAPRRLFHLMSDKIDFQPKLKLRPMDRVGNEWIVLNSARERTFALHQLAHFEISNKKNGDAVRL